MSWEINKDVANAIAGVASFMTVVMWLAPVRDVWTAPYSIYRSGNTENVATSFGFVAGTFNCILWNLFAFNRLETMMVPFILNMAGFLLNISFVLCYFIYGNSKARKNTMNQTLGMLFITAVAIGFWVVQDSNQIVGYFAAFVNILMLFGPLAAAGDVIRSRSSRGLSFLPLLMTLVASMIWCTYGVYIQEIPAVLPNALGIIFGVLQIALFVWARRQEKKTISIEEDLDNEGFQPVVTPERPTYSSRDPEAPAVRERAASSITAMIEGIP